MTLIPDLQRDLVDATARRNSHRRRVGLFLRLAPAGAVAAALIGATALLLGGGSDPLPSSREPAQSPQNSPTSPPPERYPEPPPRRAPQPMSGSLSKAVRFEFAGISYSIVGFRARSGSRDGVICTRLVERRGGRRRIAGATCAGERLLRRELDDNPARTTGEGGLPFHISGFTGADVTRIAVLDPQYPSRVVLSEPWSPEPWEAAPIRFFLVLIDAPADRIRDLSLQGQDRPHLEARLTSGELVDVVP
jgi:hypothetical protein